jgi:hypothetical protein
LGLLTNYYYDCPARRGPHADQLRSTIRRALRGERAAMRLVIVHEGIFSTDDNEAYSEVPSALLRAVGDERFAAFLVRESPRVQQAALSFLSPKDIRDFDGLFPKTAKLYRARFPR